jgi:hypothetical protein
MSARPERVQLVSLALKARKESGMEKRRIGIDHVKEMTTRAYNEGAYRRLKGLERVAVFVRDLPLAAGSTLRIGPNSYEVEDESYLVFVDLMYEANFTHPVLYELHNTADGTVRVIEEEFPISDPETERSLIAHILPGKGGE